MQTLSAVAGGILASSATTFGQKTAKKSNILFILTDDQRFDTIAALGNRDIITPNIDSLVQDGTAFTNAYILGASSSAVCAPSRAMLMTGRSFFRLPQSITVPWTVPREDEGKCPYITLPELLREQGYATFGTGKWHSGAPLFAKGFTHGSSIFFSGMGDHYRLPLTDYDPDGNYPNPDDMKKRRKTAYELPKGKHSSEVFSDAAISFLRDYKEDAPFFMFVSYTAPHDPREMPAKYRRLYDAEKLPVPKSFAPNHPFENGDMKGRDEKLAKWPRTKGEIRGHLADYYAMITHLDAQIGRVLKTLEQTHPAGDTIVVFAGDNGLAVGRHGLMGKQNLYEHSIGVPLIFRGPGIDKGRRTNALCYLHDVFPTLCGLSGLTVPDSIESKSLADILRRDGKDVYRSLGFAYRDIQRAFRDDRYKLIEYAVKGKRTTQLFDLQKDRDERNDLAADPAYAKKIKQMQTKLKQWQKQVGDTSNSFI